MYQSTHEGIPGFYCRPPNKITVAENEDEFVDPVEAEFVLDTFTRYMLSLGHKAPKSLQQIRDFLQEENGINLSGYRSFSILHGLAQRVKRNEGRDFTLERYAK